jgi:FkbH-like protein
VFVDDSRFERDEVKNSIPLINVLDTADLNSLYDIINIGEQFDTYEAKERINQYFTEEKRLIAKENFRGTEKDFMRSCNISVEVSVAIEDDLIRMKELVDRTNQLNSTGYRYSMNELKALVSDKNFIILIAYIRDTYGDYREGYIINQLIISCRLMGKGIAQALLHVAYNRAVTDKINKLKCLFLRNEFNRQMILLFSTNHMTRSIGDNSTYELCVDEHTILKPEWLALIDHTLVCE